MLYKYGRGGRPLPEFHFTDLINRRKDYRGLDTETVKNIFKDFTALINRYNLPYFIQTMTPRTMDENGLRDPKNRGLDELALEFIFMRIKIFAEEYNLRNMFEIFIDEGLRKSGHFIVIDRLSELMNQNIATFKTSHEFLLIQVADFFAFVLNRNQLIAIKEQRTEFDVEIMGMVNSIFRGNLGSGSVDVLMGEDFTKADYDDYQIQKRKETGIYPFWKKINKA
ncbi:DUF3800 domain-containing protein [Mucilaginibacter ginsenosidivorax]|uniref:DUF3800 domain-containing protein n=1 Tax=Mucilaginibacter ginsenosidivorax TaxID=862126 RepID=A0A5B8W5V9_9SPHI|nr:DUF3800 domain-containing protein [Mucilaginibacter ginsenosidivorax]QEC78979.1 DUF3800 domain-containing protein [Mucilaginibacter ginsenosidivorax]